MSQPIPFTEEDQLLILGESETVPGHPHVKLDAASLSHFLEAELSTGRLEQMYRILFLVSRPRNISPMHHQAVRGRKILITERPDLHLVTYPGYILIKPLPLYLMSHTFYEAYLLGPARASNNRLAKEAHGFLRSYASLILHESDFRVAKRHKLVPALIEWEDWCRFIRQLKYTPSIITTEYRKPRNLEGCELPNDSVPMYSDSLVAPRYHYGELGLLRLNFWCRMSLREWEYLPVHTHYDYPTYFARFVTPYLFVFGALTVVLTAVQVELAARPNGSYVEISSDLVRFTIFLTVVGLGFLPAMFLFFTMRELYMYFVHHISQI